MNIAGASIAAVLSAAILYETLIAGSLLRETGLIGIFLAAMFSHITVIGRDMFVPAFLTLTVQYFPLLLGLVTGIGAAIGELTTYYLGLGIKDALDNTKKEDAVSRWVEKYGIVALFVVAASPLPDVPLVLLAGSARFPLRRFLLVEAIGKTLWYSLGAAVGGFFFTQMSAFVEEMVLSTIIAIVSFTICIIFTWGKSREKLLQVLDRIRRKN